MSTLENLSPPADLSPGWKTDPLNGNQYRWWSGEGWTEHAGVGQSWNRPSVTQAPTPTATAPMPGAAQDEVPAPLVPAQKQVHAPVSGLRPDIEEAGQRMKLTVGTKREMVRLRNLLHGEERVLEMAKGDLSGRAGLLVLSDERLLFLSDSAAGSHEEYYGLDTVAGISFSGGRLSGKLTVQLPDQQLNLSGVSKADGKRLVTYSQLAIGSAQAPAPAIETDGAPSDTSGETSGDTFKLLRGSDAFWRRSNQMGVLNTDLAKQLGAENLGARLWRIEPGQASTRHRHRRTSELYLLLEGKGKLRVADQLLELAPMDSVRVDAAVLRQLFNDTDADQLWLVTGAPQELANTIEMNEADLAWLYPDGPKAMPPELRG